MRYVKQKHKNGCAIAAMAMVSGIGYDKVFKIAHPFYKNYIQPPRYTGLSTETILKCMENLNVSYELSFKKQDFSKLKHNAMIVFWSGNNNRHAVVWDAKNKKILDPWHTATFTKLYIENNMAYLIKINED